ncbi:MAG TPA: SIS domain-containing protein [Mesorhizobium sp.]|jgi:glucosamine--fructose-6-phosphate aminotransferase (isomerizing)|nr:SIS domain-containing protein [Mesorhizobium sp.]
MTRINGDSAYAADILSQPDCLRRVQMADVARSLDEVTRSIGRFAKIVLTGMGASHAALRPLWLSLLGRGYPAWHLESSEILEGGLPLLDRSTLIIVASQSGRSAEIVALADAAAERGAVLLAITNDVASPLSRAARAVVDIKAGVENAVSTKTYLNTLGATIAIRRTLLGEPPDDVLDRAADSLSVYLLMMSERVDAMKDAIGLPERLFYLARGRSLAAAQCGSLIMKEAAKWPVEAQSAAQFRHGPLELADGRLAAVLLVGSAQRERELNSALAVDLKSHGARTFLLDTGPPGAILAIPQVPDDARPIAEILPLQLLSIAVAQQTGVEPGVFRHLSKVTIVL